MDPGGPGGLVVIKKQPSGPAGFALLVAVVERVLDAADSFGRYYLLEPVASLVVVAS